MALRIRKFRSIDEFEWFLRGGVIGAVLPLNTSSGPGLFGLVGQTVTFTSPAGAVTFVAGADPSGFLTILEIKTQIETAIAGIQVSFTNNRMTVVEILPANGIDIGSAAAEPARGILGFAPAAGAHVSCSVINPFTGHAASTVPYLVQVVSSSNDSYTALIME